MIKDNDIIRAEQGKVLHYIPDNKIWGRAVRLVIYKGHQMTEEDFIEEDETEFENIDGTWYDFRNKTYAYIKTLIIKLHYSNDDQIAIMLNNDEDKMREMQDWRAFATTIANKYSNKN